jgi:hypothetical protein
MRCCSQAALDDGEQLDQEVCEKLLTIPAAGNPVAVHDAAPTRQP